MKTIQDYLREDYVKWNTKPYIYWRSGETFVGKTFGETITDVCALAAGLLARGYRGKKIMVYGENSYQWMVADLAIMGYVGVSAGTDKEWKYDDINRMMNVIGAAAIIYAPSKQSVIDALKESNPNVDYICMNGDFETILDEGRRINASKSDMFDFEEVDYEGCAKIVFSSGTTAFPKAVMLSHRNLFCGFENLSRRAFMNEEDSCYLFLPLHHTYGGICNFFFSIISGISIYICSDTKKIAEELQMVNPTVFSAVPIILERFYQAAMQAGAQGAGAAADGVQGAEVQGVGASTDSRAAGEQFTKEQLYATQSAVLKSLFGNRLKYLFCGGAFLDPQIRLFYKQSGIHLMEAYALSETTSILAIEYCGSQNIYNSGTIFENIEVIIDAPDENGVGEILVRGDNIFLGYCNNEEATRAVFNEQGFFKTGDLGYIKDGDIYLKGRKKRMLLGGNGENIYPDEIEAVILEEENILKARVSMENGTLHASIFIPAGTLNPGEALIERVNDKMPKYKKIRTWEYVVDSLDKRIK